MKIRLNVRIYLVFILGFLFFGCNTISKKRNLKIAHGLNTDHPVNKAMMYMADELKKSSKGMMSLEIYANQQLGSERQCLELLQIGSLDMTKVSAAVLENFSPDMKVFGIPFLFKNREHRFKSLDSDVGKEILDGGEKYWLKGLGYYDAGSRSFYTKSKPILKPSDLKGLKIRVMESQSAMSMITNMGGSPTPISSGELYTALQQGVVDGAENNIPTFFLSRDYEVCNFFSLDEHTAIPDVLLISTHTWNSLSSQEKKWLQDTANKSVEYQRKLWRISEEEALNAIKNKGVNIYTPSNSEFKEAVKPMYESYENNERISDLINRITNIN